MKRPDSLSQIDRKLTASISFRLYQDNYEYVEGIAGPDERSEVLRNLVDEGIRGRLNPPADTGADADIKQSLKMVLEQLSLLSERCGRYESLFNKYEELAEREAKLKRGVISHLRVLAAILGEVLAAAIAARRLTWNYCAFESLTRSEHSAPQIKERYEAESRAWRDERDATTMEVRRILGDRYGELE